MDKQTKTIICTAFSNGKRHDFKLFKESKTKIHPEIKTITDTGYQGIKKLHCNAELPKKKSKKNPLTKEDKKKNQELASERVLNENVIGMLKRFKIIADKYRNRRKRFGLRFNLIAGIYNLELAACYFPNRSITFPTLREWLLKFISEGIEGLREKSGKGRKKKLASDQEEEFRKQVELLQELREGGRIRAKDVQILLKENFCVDHALPSVYHVLERCGLSWISSRSKHPKSDPEAQEEFKKKFEKK